MFETAHRQLLTAAFAALLVIPLAACDDDGPAPAESPVVKQEVGTEAEPTEAETSATAPEVGTAPDAEALKAAHTKRLKEMDAYARGLLESFDSRVYAPERDAKVKSGVAVIAVRVKGKEGTYRASFDGSLPEDERVALTADEGNPEMPKGTEKQLMKWARISFEGPFDEIVHYQPPTQLLLTPSQDKKNRVVTAQPHKHNVQVSYSVNDQDLVVIRGTSVVPQAEIAYFDWEPWRGRYLLKEMTFHGSDSKATFDYGDKGTDGVLMLERARYSVGDNVFDAALRYEDLRVE